MATINYEISQSGADTLQFSVDIERPAASVPVGAPKWTQLGCKQCPNCPLTEAETSHCPAALDLIPVVEAFNQIKSYQEVTVSVDMDERRLSKDCDAQTALGALQGLIMASSDCPILGRLKGMARMHLPFQSQEETLVRFAGAYAVGQLIQSRQGQGADWDLAGLDKFFDELMTVNQAFKARLHTSAKQDASMNAVSALAMQAMGAQMSLDDTLEDLQPYALI